MLIFFKTKDTKILLFLVKYYTIEMDIISSIYYQTREHWNTPNLIKGIKLVGRVFTNGPGEQGSILDCVIPKTLKMVLDTSLLNPQQYTVGIKGKVEQSRERSSTLSDTLV